MKHYLRLNINILLSRYRFLIIVFWALAATSSVFSFSTTSIFATGMDHFFMLTFFDNILPLRHLKRVFVIENVKFTYKLRKRIKMFWILSWYSEFRYLYIFLRNNWKTSTCSHRFDAIYFHFAPISAEPDLSELRFTRHFPRHFCIFRQIRSTQVEVPYINFLNTVLLIP